MLSVMVLEVLLPTHTFCVLPVRKSSTQLQRREVLSPKCPSFCVSCWGMIVLNAELKSRNSICRYEFFESRWVKAGWRVVEMVSSMDLFDLYAN